jgi:hypothetical protein
VFIRLKNTLHAWNHGTDEDFEMKPLEVKGSDAKIAWKIKGICRARNEDVRLIERLATRTDSLEKSKEPSIIGGDLILLYFDWKGKVYVTLTACRHVSWPVSSHMLRTPQIVHN